MNRLYTTTENRTRRGKPGLSDSTVVGVAIAVVTMMLTMYGIAWLVYAYIYPNSRSGRWLIEVSFHVVWATHLSRSIIRNAFQAFTFLLHHVNRMIYVWHSSRLWKPYSPTIQNKLYFVVRQALAICLGAWDNLGSLRPFGWHTVYRLADGDAVSG